MAAQRKESLLLELDESNLAEKMRENLTITEEQMDTDMYEGASCTNNQLFKFLSQSSLYGKRHKARYSQDEVEFLSKVLDDYPFSHARIQKILKMPKTTFYSLRKEINNHKGVGAQSRRQTIKSRELTEVEKKFVSRILAPPTIPLTVSYI